MEEKPVDMSIQGWINEYGSYDQERLNIYLKDGGFYEAKGSPDSVFDNQIHSGDQICYITNQYDNLLFRSGGYYISSRDGDPEGTRYALYNSFNRSRVFSLQYINIEALYYKPKKSKKTGRGPSKSKIIKYEIPDIIEDAKYKVLLKDKDGIEHLVYNTNDKGKYTRFINTAKYKESVAEP